MRPTKRQAEQVVAALVRQYPRSVTRPTLVRDWDWFGTGTSPWAIVWEEGPHDWAHVFPYGGRSEEFGREVSEVRLPAGVWVEPITGWAIGLYRDEEVTR